MAADLLEKESGMAAWNPPPQAWGTPAQSRRALQAFASTRRVVEFKPGAPPQLGEYHIILHPHSEGVELAGGSAVDGYAQRISQAVITAYRSLRPVRAVYWWKEGDWLVFRAYLQTWTRATRREVFQANAELRDEFKDAKVYFEVEPLRTIRPRPDTARLLFLKEAGRP